MPLPVEVDVYELDGTIVTSLTHGVGTRQVRALKGRDLGDGPGDGEVVVDYDHPQVAEVTGDRIVQVADTRNRFAFLVDERPEVVKPSSKNEKDRLVTASGDGLLSVLSRVRTLGTLAPGVRPQSERRLWGGASPELPRGDWTTPYVQTRATSVPQRPWDMPSEFAEWLWTRAEPGDPGDDHPVEGAWFHTTFTVDTETPVLFVQTADDSFRQFLQGVELQVEEREFPADVWHWPYTAGCVCSPDITYHYVVYVHNDAGRGASITELWTTGPTGMVTPIRLSGDGAEPVYGTWTCLIQDDDDPFPGCTPGLILETYLAEGQARGEGLDITLMFDADEDSNGEPWATSAEVEYANDGTLLEVFDAMTEVSIDGWAEFGASGVEIYAVNKGTRGTTGAFTVTSSQVLSHKVVDTYDIENSVLVVSEKGPRLVEHAASITAHGPRPAKSPIRCGKVIDPNTMEEIGQTYLAPRAWPGRSRIIEVTPMTDFDAAPGDSGTVDSITDLQVASIGFELEPGGLLRKVPNFETPYQRKLRDSQRVVDRLIRYAGQMGSVRMIDSGTQVPVGRLNAVKLCSWSFQDAEELEEIEWDLPEEPSWQRYKVEEKARLCRVVFEADWAEPDGAGGHDKVTTADSVVQVLIDSAPVPVGAWLCTIGEDDTTGSNQLWGPALIYPEQTLSIAPVTNGGHINGSVTLYASAPL